MKTIIDIKTNKIVNENGRKQQQRICLHLFANINRNNPIQELKWAIDDFKNGKHVNICLL